MLERYPELKFNLRLLTGYIAFTFLAVLIGEALVIQEWKEFIKFDYFLFPSLFCFLCLIPWIIKVSRLTSINKIHKGVLVALLFILLIGGSSLSLSSIVSRNKELFSTQTPVPVIVVFLGTLPLASIIFLAIFIDQEVDSGKMNPLFRMAVAASAVCSAPMLFGSIFITEIFRIKRFEYNLLFIISEALIVFILQDHLKHIAYLSREKTDCKIVKNKFKRWQKFLILYLLISPLTIKAFFYHNVLLKICFWLVIFITWTFCIHYGDEKKFRKFRFVSEISQFSLVFLLILSSFTYAPFTINKIILDLQKYFLPNLGKMLGIISSIVILGINIFVRVIIAKQSEEKKEISKILWGGAILCLLFSIVLFPWAHIYSTTLFVSLAYCLFSICLTGTNLIYCAPDLK